MKETDRDPAHGRELHRLLRHLAGGAARIGVRGEGRIAVHRDDGPSRAFGDRVLAEAIASGLVRRSADMLSIDPAGLSWLRRRLVEDPSASFSAQHRDVRRAAVEIDGVSNPVTVNTSESPLAALMRLKARDGRPFLDEESFRAGERLRCDFTRGQLQPRVSANWEASVASGGHRTGNGVAEISDAALAARLRVERAIEAVGPELSGVLLDVCCFLKGLEIVERERQWPVRSGKLMLKTALCALARHYWPPRANASRRTGHRWGAPGYRPEIVSRRP